MSSTKDKQNGSAKLCPEASEVRTLMLAGKIGLELETQRIDRTGHLAQTPHPFEEEPYIDRDFGEAQIEINTPPSDDPEKAEALLHEQLRIAQTKLYGQGELLWPFSGPPALGEDAEIRIAEYTGELEKKTVYRRYLAEKYGKRIMTLCGIHFNYSFSEELLENSFLHSGMKEYRAFKDALYLQLAEKVLVYGWVIVALLSASPLVDGSYYSAGVPSGERPGDIGKSANPAEGKTITTGYSSLRCSREGYWNPFDPVLSYENIPSYAASIQEYREKGMLRHEGELYYPVRIKPAGKYSLRNLCESGVNHIELRMIDLNPLCENGIDLRDLRFLQMFLVWLASLDRILLDEAGQLQAIRNLKEAARYPWDEIRICCTKSSEINLQQELETVLAQMKSLFRNAGPVWQEALRYQEEKVRQSEKRYAQQVIRLYGENYLSDGMKRAEELQERFTERSTE